MEQETCKVTEFHNTEFGAIRVIEDQGRLLFCGTDVAFALGYSKPRNAINMHCKGALKKGALTAGGVQTMTFIPEGDVYRLITKSHLPSAQRFESWVFDEILPAIRKTGGYMSSDLLESVRNNPEILLEFAQRLLDENNRNEVVFAYKDDSTPIVELTFDLTNDKPEVPQTTEGTPGTPSAGNPKTGDETNLWLPVVLLAVSVSGIAGLLAARRKRKRK